MGSFQLPLAATSRAPPAHSFSVVHEVGPLGGLRHGTAQKRKGDQWTMGSREEVFFFPLSEGYFEIQFLYLAKDGLQQSGQHLPYEPLSLPFALLGFLSPVK